MTTNDLNNKAYSIVTGNCLTKSFNKNEYNAMTEEEIYLYVWEPFEILDAKALCLHVEQIVNEIIVNFDKFVIE